MICGLAGSDFDLAAQPGDADVDAALERLFIAVMRQLEELVAPQDLEGVEGEGLQQVEFHRGQRDDAAILAAQLAGIEIEQELREGAVVASGCRRRGAHEAGGPAAQHAADPRQQLARVERLAHIVVGAELEPGDAVVRLSRCRQHDDADIGLLAQIAGEAEPVLARHVDVEECEVDAAAFQNAPEIGAGIGLDDRESVPGEVFGDHLADFRLVIHHADGHGFGLHP